MKSIKKLWKKMVLGIRDEWRYWKMDWKYNYGKFVCSPVNPPSYYAKVAEGKIEDIYSIDEEEAQQLLEMIAQRRKEQRERAEQKAKKRRVRKK
ncbi:MAG: hypothetical protein IJ379_03610 [Lachnospiraceae bacterium]|nr:hypothetical protein [Lachnospiraceae bacterium]